MAKTPNHGYNVPSKGTANWHKPLNANFRQYDTDIEVRDADGNTGNYTPKTGAKFLATDTGFVYLGDGSTWVPGFAIPRYVAPNDSTLAHNIVGGHADNGVASLVSGATVLGGGGLDDGTAPTPNVVTGDYGTVCGGQGNSAGTNAAVCGGRNNDAGGGDATVAGGEGNRASGGHAVVGGGKNNVSQAANGVIAGGKNNEITASSGSAILGGDGNAASGSVATVGGGQDNEASGFGAIVPGGRGNTASGDYGLAAGFSAESLADGSFVWGDSSSHTVQSKTANEFVAQAGGGVTFWSSSDFSTGAQLKSGSGSWSAWSARTAKSNVEPVDPEAALEGVRELEIATWNYDGQDESVRHMGPMAEDFYEAFGLGGDRERIATVDADGVAFAAVQALADRLDEKDERLDEQADHIEELEDTLTERKATIARQSRQIAALQADLEHLSEQVERLSDRVESLSSGDGADEGSGHDQPTAESR